MDSLIPRACDRKTVRRAVRSRCEVVSDPEFRLLATRVVDLSTRGMRLESDEDVVIGTTVVLSLQLPGTGLWIDAEGVVTRRVHGRRREDRRRGFGIRFTRLDAADEQLLMASLLRIPPPLPARPVRRDYAALVWAIFTDSATAMDAQPSGWRAVIGESPPSIAFG